MSLSEDIDALLRQVRQAAELRGPGWLQECLGTAREADGAPQGNLQRVLPLGAFPQLGAALGGIRPRGLGGRHRGGPAASPLPPGDVDVNPWRRPLPPLRLQAGGGPVDPGGPAVGPLACSSPAPRSERRASSDADCAAAAPEVQGRRPSLVSPLAAGSGAGPTSPGSAPGSGSDVEECSLDEEGAAPLSLLRPDAAQSRRTPGERACCRRSSSVHPPASVSGLMPARVDDPHGLPPLPGGSGISEGTAAGAQPHRAGLDPLVNCTHTSNGGNASVTCKIPPHMEVIQVTWQRRAGKSYETLVTHSEKYGVKISKQYENRLSVTQTKDQRTSSIAISQLEKEDQACFMVIFNIYPAGALKGEVCLPKVRGVREVICKGPADFSVTLNPPQIKTQHQEPPGTNIQKGLWLNSNNNISPGCNFQLRSKTKRKRRSVAVSEDQDEIFTIECKTSGSQRASITWNNGGDPISREERVTRTGDLITVTSSLHHNLSTLPKGEEISCNISYGTDSAGEETSGTMEKNCLSSCPPCAAPLQENNHGGVIVRIVILSLVVLLLVGVVWVVVRHLVYSRRQKNSSKNFNKVENGSSTPLHGNVTLNLPRTPGTEIKQRKWSTVKKNKNNNERNNLNSSFDVIPIGEEIGGTPGTNKKLKYGSRGKQNKTAKKLTF
ncbi:uncharacterized protein RB166_002324 [Leptodactylus fuscus]|uniref:uncharacterized protein LOC142193525 n=1 Tax=Leptodactylus fuscus TaxID=238119 RepID=UPI003F4E69AC